MTFLPPSAWSMTPQERIDRLETYLSITDNCKSPSVKRQRARYKAEIGALKSVKITR